MIKPVLLWSDGLIFLLVVSLGLFVRLIRNNKQTRDRWRQVFSSRVGVASFIIIGAYLVIALLDSVHFREALPETENQQETHYSQELRSLLDIVLNGMVLNEETTYSEPFS